jgi:3-hydroxybutyryl-CoA dehydrogenase
MKEILVVGAGTMGAGIAEVAAKTGACVQLSDVDAVQLEKARALIDRSLAKAVERGKIASEAAEEAEGRITFTSDPAVERVQLIVEAVPENLQLKKKLSAELGARSPDAIYGTNTSSLSVTEIAAATPHPERVLGLHFFNPPPVMKLLEVIRAEQTSEESLAAATAWAESADKQPIVIKDVPGFATSRLGIILGMEAIRMLEMDVGSAADIDAAMELGYRHPMGPLRLTDLVGLDVRLAIAEHLTKELGPQFTPPPLLRQKVRAGKLGKKSGEGFYRWD